MNFPLPFKKVNIIINNPFYPTDEAGKKYLISWRQYLNVIMAGTEKL